MRSRGLVVAIAVVLALLAAAGVIVYTSNLEEQVKTENTTTVLVSSADIPANTQLDPLIANGQFREVDIPNDALVLGAVTSFDELSGQTTAAPILANEQIPSTRLASAAASTCSASPRATSVLDCPSLGPQSVNGAITQGSQHRRVRHLPEGHAGHERHPQQAPHRPADPEVLRGGRRRRYHLGPGAGAGARAADRLHRGPDPDRQGARRPEPADRHDDGPQDRRRHVADARPAPRGRVAARVLGRPRRSSTWVSCRRRTRTATRPRARVGVPLDKVVGVG